MRYVNRDVNVRPAGAAVRPHVSAISRIDCIGLPLLMLVLCSCGCDRQQTLTPQVPDGHARMVATLKVIGNSGLEERMQFGLNTVENEEQSLSFLPESLSEKRFALLCQLGKRRMWLGDTEQAIVHYLAAVELVENHKQSTPQPVREAALFQLGLAYLRLGENENCVNCTNGESCILPIRNEGVHVNQRGSRSAIKYFMQLLELNPDHMHGRWLLNLACMTVGDYPEGVPEEFLVDPGLYDSQADFPRFPNVASSCGLANLSLSGGCIVDDFDGDGDLDVVTSSSGFNDPLRYFRNDSGQFADATTEANLTGLNGGLNLIHADYDNDDDLDIYVMRGAWWAQDGRIPNSLLQNDGTGRFRDVTFECGMGAEHFPSQTAAWLDFDNDGDLDLYVGNEHYSCQLFQNDGRGGFRDVASLAGVENNRFTKAVTCGDFNNDRFPDIYVSNLGGENRLLRNNRNGTFTDIARELGVMGPHRSFPTWFWDYNQDGVLDLFVATYSSDMHFVGDRYFGLPQNGEYPGLYEGDGDGGFRNVAGEQNLTCFTQAMGANFGDLDNDGFPDFYIGTGYPDYDALMPNLMFWNRQGQGFVDVTTSGGFGHLQKGHGIGFADIDGDGDQDIFQQMGGAFPGDRAADCLYQNPGFRNNWLTLKLTGRQSNRSAIGARIKAECVDSGSPRAVYKWVNSGGSFGANPLRQQIGLGKAKRITRLEIYWPASDTIQEFFDVAVNQTIEIVEGQQRISVMKNDGAVGVP